MISNSVTINGLVINDEIAARALRYDGWLSIDEVDGLDIPEVENEVQPLAFQDGVIMSETYYRERLLTIDAIIYGVQRSTRNTIQSAIRNALNPILDAGVTISVIYREEGEAFDRIIFCRPTGKFKASRKKQEFGKREIQFSLLAEDPRIYKNVLSTRKLVLNKNLFLHTSDLTQSVWAVVGGGVKTNATTLTTASANDGVKQSFTLPSGNLANRTFTISAKLSGTAGQTIRFALRTPSASFGTESANITLTTTPTRYSLTFTFPSGAIAESIIEGYVRRLSGTTATSVTISEWQLEENDFADIYRANGASYSGVNGTSLPVTLPTLLGSNIGDTFTITNGGTYSSVPKIRIYGPVLNPGLVNDTLGQFLQFNYSLGVGEYIDIDMKNRIVTRENGSRVYGFLTEDSKFWKLAAGANIIGFIAETYQSGAYVTVDWRDAFI